MFFKTGVDNIRELKIVDYGCRRRLDWCHATKISHGMSPSHLYDSREFKRRGSGESETRPELTFRISDERSMLAAFSSRLDNST